MGNVKREIYKGKDLKSIRELVETSANLYSDKIAYRYRLNPKDEKTIDITYSMFYNDIRNLDTALLNLGLEGKKVVLISPNRYEWCVSYMAISIGNMTIVPLDHSLPENEIESLVARSHAEVVIFHEKYLNVFQKIKEEKTANLSHYICLDFEDDKDGMISYKRLLEYGDRLIKKGDTKYQDVKVDTKKASVMLFTSGTTSVSKAVLLSQDNLCANVNAISKIISLTSEDNMLSFLPLHHTFESSTTFLYGMSCGITIAFSDGLKYIIKNLADYKVTAIVCVPLMLDSIYKRIIKGIDEIGKTDLIQKLVQISNGLRKVKIDVRRVLFKIIINKLGGHLRLIVCGGAAMDPKTATGINNFGIEVLQGYGLTETSPVVAAESDKYRKIGSIGLPLYNVEIEIDHPSLDGIGELKVKGPSVMLGYYENEEATNEVLKDGWFYTGDLAYQDKEGFLYITGRQKNVIVLKNGKNIFPEELETLINRLTFVLESIVYAKSNLNDLLLCAKIVYDKEEIKEIYGEKTKEEYTKLVWEDIKTINQTMPKYKYIKEITLTEEQLIKTTTKKVKRHEEIKKILG